MYTHANRENCRRRAAELTSASASADYYRGLSFYGTLSCLVCLLNSPSKKGKKGGGFEPQQCRSLAAANPFSFKSQHFWGRFKFRGLAFFGLSLFRFFKKELRECQLCGCGGVKLAKNVQEKQFLTSNVGVFCTRRIATPSNISPPKGAREEFRSPDSSANIQIGTKNLWASSKKHSLRAPFQY